MSTRFYLFGLLFEFAICLLAIGLSWAFGVWSPEGLQESLNQSSVLGDLSILGLAKSTSIGVLSVVPLVAFGAWIYFGNPRPFRRLRKTADEMLVPFLGNLSYPQAIVLSLAAGICEEVFFRGFLQIGLTQWLGGGVPAAILGLLIASAIFGIVHWVHAEYAFATFAIGCYLGIVMWLSEGIIAPIISHALYDFVAICFVFYLAGRQSPKDESSNSVEMETEDPSQTDEGDAAATELEMNVQAITGAN